jgi:DnaJ-class molecular chaperone
MSDYYSILGIDKNSSQEDIKKAYRSLAMKHHPDRTGGDDTMFKEIQTAYSILGDPQKKSQYDAMQSGSGQNFRFNINGQDMPPGFAGFGNIDDIFRNFNVHFGGDPFGDFRQPRRNKDLRIQLSVSLLSTLSEQTKTISVQTTNGHRETIEVKIPVGISNNSTIKYPGLGDNFFDTLGRGDLYVQVVVEPNPNFQVQDIDLFTELNIDCLTAITGSTEVITGLDGKQFSLSIPAGTQTGAGFRLNDQGLYALNSSTRGSLIVRINVIVPTDLNADHLELIKQIRDSRTTHKYS